MVITNELIQSDSRGVLVVDKHPDLVAALQTRNIKALSAPAVLTDDQIRELIIPHRIFVTNNSKDFLDDATSFEYSIIGTEAVSKDAKALAAMISHAIIDHGLWSKSFGWVLRLQAPGNHELEVLPK